MVTRGFGRVLGEVRDLFHNNLNKQHYGTIHLKTAKDDKFHILLVLFSQ